MFSFRECGGFCSVFIFSVMMCANFFNCLSIFTKNELFFFNSIEFCNDMRETAAPGVGFPLKSSSQERPGLVSDYRTLWTLILNPFTQRNLSKCKVFSFLETTLGDRAGGVAMTFWPVSARPGGTFSGGRAVP